MVNVSVVIPVFNEEAAIEETIYTIKQSLNLSKSVQEFEIIVVDDASEDRTYQKVKDLENVAAIVLKKNIGYGGAIKAGIKVANYDVVAITDADGTYENEKMGRLVEEMFDFDMAVGLRNYSKGSTTIYRRIARGIINKFASSLVKYKIPDVNSGLRIFKKELADEFMHLFPKGFSFTTTITLAALFSGYKVKWVDVDYKKRIGASKIKFYNFFTIMYGIVKTSFYFKKRRNGFIDRLLKEIRYIKQKDWTYIDVGMHWDSVINYDDINSKTYTYFQRFIKAFEISTLKDRQYLLDICSRTGNGSKYFYEKNKIRKVVCADVSPHMQKICSKNLNEAGVDFSVALYNSLPLPFSDNEFDGVLCFETIEHMPNPERFVAELARVMKYEGKLILTTPNMLWAPVHWVAAIFGIHHSEGPCSFLKRRDIIKYANASGLKLMQERTSVLVPFNRQWTIKLNSFFEKILPEYILRLLALRRIFIFQKAG